VSDLKGELASLRIDRDGPAQRVAWRGLLLGAALLLVIVAGAWWLTRGRAAFASVEIETTRPAVATGSHPRAGTPILTASGYLVPRRKAVVSAKIQGRLSELRVEEGSRVKEGEIIARLENADYDAQVARARASVQRAEADLSEMKRQLRLAEQLSRESVVSRDNLEAAQSRVSIAEAAVAQAKADQTYAEAQFRNTLIRAPFDGVVLKKMAEVGESVAPIPPGVNISTASGAVVALADLDTLEVEVDVAEANVARLGPDQPAEVSVEAFPEKTYHAVLRQIIPTADRTKATVQVKVTILDKDPALKPEMNAKVNFLEPETRPTVAEAPAGPTITVPSAAVVERGGRSVVFEVQDGRARSRGVVTGRAREGFVVVREGLSGTETLVLSPPATLQDGDAVRIKS
jgi:HlyD family secretion protein